MTLPQNFRGRRVTVVGLGIEGIDLVRHLASEGAVVTVSDARPAAALGERLAAIEGAEARALLGEQGEDSLLDAEFVFASQGVPTEIPALRAARRAGIPVSSMTALFMERCPAPVAGITGSSGKSTTTALAGAMLEAAGLPHVVGGNIGIGLLGLLPRIDPATRVLVELSHTQLEGVATSPALACVTNVTPNHLDRYAWPDYVALKRRIFAFQQPSDTVILNRDDEVCAGFAGEAPSRVEHTSMAADLPADGVFLNGAAPGAVIVRRAGGDDRPVLPRAEIGLRGEHNVHNVLSAIAVAAHLGAGESACAEAARSFSGIPHRLEEVGSAGAVRYVNDSIATTPERAGAALRSYEEPLVLLLGGRDKNLPTAGLAAEAAARCRAVVTFGEAAGLFARAVGAASAAVGPALEQADGVADAVERAARLARPGDVVLLSPAGTSFDSYRSFEERGRAFRDAVSALPGFAPPVREGGAR
ncbi:MAG: UDP-N-acetylmuramoyl-L-alanine--D-glutamate ligase [Chloroflexi bacterium]|nr:UDP-N-acetylmuramoyl-L-alanine--D-glutamate ligase [Chloroflexota bacterium]